jgi:hypothetical protein
MAGDRLFEVPLPIGSRVVYPRQPLPNLRDPMGALRDALDEPLASEPLSARLRQGMKVVIAVEALYHGSPANLYWLGKLLGELTALTARKDVARTTVIIATGIHRRLFPEEKKLLLRAVTPRGNATVEECDPEGPIELVEVAEFQSKPVYLHPSATAADLLITLSVAALPDGGGYHPLVLGLGGLDNARVAALGASPDVIDRIGKAIEERLAVFAIEVVLDSRNLNPQPDFLSANEDDLTATQRVQLTGYSHLPKRAASRLADLAAGAGLIGVFCGSTHAVSRAARRRFLEQYAVPLERPADILITGLPSSGPYNTRAALNPVLVRHLLQGWVLRQHSAGCPLVRGGTVVLLHPCTNRFDHQQHTAHYDFFHSVLSETHSPESFTDAEAAFVSNPALLTAFRTGYAYHPGHPFLLWQQSLHARKTLGRVIVVGADNESVPRVLGYETATSVAEALYRAGNGQKQARDILCLHNPLTVTCQLPDNPS